MGRFSVLLWERVIMRVVVLNISNLCVVTHSDTTYQLPVSKMKILCNFISPLEKNLNIGYNNMEY